MKDKPGMNKAGMDKTWMDTMAVALQGLREPPEVSEEFAAQVQGMLDAVDALSARLRHDDEPSGFRRALLRHRYRGRSGEGP